MESEIRSAFLLCRKHSENAGRIKKIKLQTYQKIGGNMFTIPTEVYVVIAFVVIVAAVLYTRHQTKEKQRLEQEIEELSEKQNNQDFETVFIDLNPDQYLEIKSEYAPFLMSARTDEMQAEMIRLFEEKLTTDIDTSLYTLGDSVFIINEKRHRYHNYWRCTKPSTIYLVFLKETVDFSVNDLTNMPGYKPPKKGG
jgi:hypothetical protein